MGYANGWGPIYIHSQGECILVGPEFVFCLQHANNKKLKLPRSVNMTGRTRTGQTTQLTNMICVGCIVCIEFWIRNATRFKVHSINVVRTQRTYSIYHFTKHMEICQWQKHFFSMYNIKIFLTRGHQCMYNWSYCVFLPNRYKHRRYQRTPDQHSTVSWHPIWNMIKPYRAGTELIRFNIANIMAADALAPCVARASAPMILTM